MNNNKYDNLLIGILQNEGQIGGFLDAVIGFLYRRTDYFKIMKSRTDKMGFTPGTAFNLLVEAFKRYEKLAEEDEQRRERLSNVNKIQPSHALKEETTSTATEDPSNVSQPSSSETTPSVQRKHNKLHSSGTQSTETATNTHSRSTDSVTNTHSRSAETATNTHSRSTDSVTNTHSRSAETVTNTHSRIADTVPNTQSQNTEADDADPELTKQQAVFQTNSESYNGAIRDQYAWSQSIQDLDVHVKIPKHIKKGRDIQVSIDRQHLKVSYKDVNGDLVLVIDDDLCWDVNKEESMWNLVPGEHVLVTLDKKQERWWEALLKSEPKISVRKIDASRPMTDLDDEAQSKIEEMMYNERQKRLGLPQSHEKKVHDVLAQAWNAEGSPFKGQPFDPSKISVGQDGMVSINEQDTGNTMK